MIAQLIEDGASSRLGRAGADIESVVWPTPEVRFVARQLFHPFTGEPKIAVIVQGPEIQPYRKFATFDLIKPRAVPYCVEVHFEMHDDRAAAQFQKKACVILAAAQLEGKRFTREAFLNEVMKLPDSVLKENSGTTIIAHEEEKREAGKVF